MLTNKYLIKNLKIGDKFAVYINRQIGGISMGPDVNGKPEHLTYVNYAGNIYGLENVGQAYFDDLTTVGIPLHDHHIYDVISGAGSNIIKQVALKDAIKIGHWAFKNYVKQYGEIPLKRGDIIVATHDYNKKNNELGLRNNHRVLSSGDIMFENWSKGSDSIIVYSPSVKKTALLALDAFTIS